MSPALDAAEACDEDIACWVGKLDDSDVLVARKAAYMLGRFGGGNAEAIGALTGKLDHADIQIRLAALTALDHVATDGAPAAVQRIDDRVRVSVQLIDAAADDHLWAEAYDKRLTAANVFAIQSEVAAAIANTLQANLTADERDRLLRAPTDSLAAYEAYLHGRQRLAGRSSVALTAPVRSTLVRSGMKMPTVKGTPFSSTSGVVPSTAASSGSCA